MLYQVENWHIVRDKVMKELGINIHKMRFGVDDFYIPGTNMIEISNFEDLSDEELFEKLKGLHDMSGTFVVKSEDVLSDQEGNQLLLWFVDRYIDEQNPDAEKY